MTALKIFVSGASGFIGQALVVKVLNQGHQVISVDTSSLATVPEISWTKAHQHSGGLLRLNLLNHAELLPYLADCDCAIYLTHNEQDPLQEQLRFAISANQSLLQACIKARVKKFIQISSTSVYGDPPPSYVITEEAPLLASLRTQTALQQMAENLVLETPSGDTEVIVLQLGQVYGPGAGGETAQMLRQMQMALMPLVRSGSGYCNPIYIDDVMMAIIRACEIPNLHQQRFIIGPDQPVTWKELLSGYESILGEKTLINLPLDYLCSPQDSMPLTRALMTQILQKRKFIVGANAITQAIWRKPIKNISPDEFRALAAQPVFSNQKAHDRLNFQPQISLSTGLSRIREWWSQNSLKVV
jgi:nucleoside-diphosphate-sugar epimerase